MNNFLYVSNCLFPEKVENRYNWIAHNSTNDHASAGAEDGGTRQYRILKNILEILKEVASDLGCSTPKPNKENHISTIPTWVLKLHPVVKYFIKAKEEAIRRVEENSNLKVKDWKVEDLEDLKDFLKNSMEDPENCDISDKLNDIYEVIRFSRLENKLLKIVERYFDLVIKKGKGKDKSQFVKNKLEGEIAWEMDHLITDLQSSLSGSELLLEALAKAKERYLGTLIHIFLKQRCVDLPLYQQCHEVEPELQEDYGLLDPEKQKKKQKKKEDLNGAEDKRKRKEKETDTDSEDKGEGKGKRKGRKKNGGSDSGSGSQMDPPFDNSKQNDLDLENKIPFDDGSDLLDDNSDSCFPVDSDDDSDLEFPKGKSKQNDKQNGDDFDFNFDLENYHDSHFPFDDQKYLLQNRNEYFIHDQEEYLENTFQESRKNQMNNHDSDQNHEGTQNYGHLWVQCENCYGLNYKKYFFLTKLNICEHCGYHLKMSSSERIELPIDQGTWNAMDENMNSKDPIEFDRNPTKIKDLPELEKSVHVPVIPVFTKKKNNSKGGTHAYCSCSDKCKCKCKSKSNYNDCKCHIPPSPCHCRCNGQNCKHFCGNNGESGIDLGKNMALFVKDLEPSSKPQNDENSNEYSHMGNKSQDNNNPIAFDSTTSPSPSPSVDAESEGGNLRLDKDSEGCIDYECEEKDYKDRIYFYQEDTGLTEAVQTGTGELNGIPVAMGVMDFQFLGGSMGSVVGEKITRLIEYATKNSLPLILVCASGGARMQEGSLSLMQMAKISAALHKYQTNKELLYISILTSPTTGGVTASFGMLGHLNISEPNTDIAFAGKRVMEQTLNLTVPEDLQKAETFVQNGLLDLIVPRDQLKNFLSELLNL